MRSFQSPSNKTLFILSKTRLSASTISKVFLLTYTYVCIMHVQGVPFVCNTYLWYILYFIASVSKITKLPSMVRYSTNCLQIAFACQNNHLCCYYTFFLCTFSFTIWNPKQLFLVPIVLFYLQQQQKSIVKLMTCLHLHLFPYASRDNKKR